MTWGEGLIYNNAQNWSTKPDEANRLAREANTIAAAAAQDARDVQKSMAFNEYLIALAALQTFDPTSEPVGDRLVSLRTRAVLLIDLLDLDGFDEWLATEQQAIVLLMHEAVVKGQSERNRLRRDLTPDEILEIDKAMHARVAGLTTNVRMCRKEGADVLPYDEFTERAWESIRATCARNGWQVPTGKIEGLEPYQPGN